jgi:hypothetical protein
VAVGIAMGSGVLFVALGLSGSGNEAAVAFRAADLDPQIARYAFGQGQAAFANSRVALGSFGVCCGWVIASTPFLPRWVGWLAIAAERGSHSAASAGLATSGCSPIIKGEPATRGPRVNQRPAGRAAEGPYRVRRASAPARQSTTGQMRNGYRGGRWHGRNPPCGPGVCQLGVRSHCRQS